MQEALVVTMSAVIVALVIAGIIIAVRRGDKTLALVAGIAAVLLLVAPFIL
jgi:hypothetical protein